MNQTSPQGKCKGAYAGPDYTKDELDNIHHECGNCGREVIYATTKRGEEPKWIHGRIGMTIESDDLPPPEPQEDGLETRGLTENEEAEAIVKSEKAKWGNQEEKYFVIDKEMLKKFKEMKLDIKAEPTGEGCCAEFTSMPNNDKNDCKCECHFVVQPSEEWYAEYKDKFWGFIKPNVSYQILYFIRKVETAAIERERQRVVGIVEDTIAADAFFNHTDDEWQIVKGFLAFHLLAVIKEPDHA